MSTKEDYRRYARECVELLRAVTDEKTKAALSHMGQVWLRLADQKTTQLTSRTAGGMIAPLGNFGTTLFAPMARNSLVRSTGRVQTDISVKGGIRVTRRQRGTPVLSLHDS